MEALRGAFKTLRF